MNAVATEAMIERAGRALVDAASAPAKVILFGSRARGDAGEGSDFDFLVIEREVGRSSRGGRQAPPCSTRVRRARRCDRDGRRACRTTLQGQGHDGRSRSTRGARCRPVLSRSSTRRCCIASRRATYGCRKLADDRRGRRPHHRLPRSTSRREGAQGALVLADSELPHTHDLELLVEQIKGTGTTVPDELSRTEWLTPWAAELRYDERIALDRDAALAAAESANGWAASLLADAKRPQPEPDPGRKAREEAPPAPEP